MRPELRDIIKKIPKHKGYRHSYRPSNIVTVRASSISKAFKAGETVTPKTLVEKRIVKRLSGRVPTNIRILGDKKLLAKLDVNGVTFTGESKSNAKTKAKPEVKVKPEVKTKATKTKTK